MKRKITILSIFMIAMVLFTSSVFAAETFKHEGKTYVIDEVKLKLDSLGENVDFWGMDSNNDYIYFDYVNTKFYKVTETSCTAMSGQEVLDLMNNTYYTYNYVGENELNIYQEKFPAAAIQGIGYIVTEDKVVDSNKEYLERTQIQDGGNLSIGYQVAVNPDLENGTYYERVSLITPKTAKIDEKISYYKYDMETNIYVKVENPKEEDAYMYVIIGESEEIKPTKIGQITQEVYDKIFLMEMTSHLIVRDEENNEIYILITYEESKKSMIYKLDGTVIKEYDSLMEIASINNKFFITAPRDEHWNIDDSKMTIIDKEGKTILENTNLPFFAELSYEKYTTYLKDYDYEANKFYNMYEYELLSQESPKYEGKDLIVKTSGELDRLTSVKVNGVELEASNYTKTSGSTIITLKNDYLKTLALGTYTLEIGYVDGTKVETKFIVDTLYNNDEEKGENSEGEAGNIGGTTGGETTGEGASGNTSGEGEAVPKPEDKLDETPKTGNATNNSNLGLYITLIILAIGAIVTRKK